MMTMTLPRACLKKIQKMQRAFLLGDMMMTMMIDIQHNLSHIMIFGA